MAASTATAPALAPAPEASAVTARLLISCPDRPGIVSAVSGFLFASGANILRSDQYSTDPSGGAFFLRMEFTVPAERQRRARRALRRWRSPSASR